MAKIITETKIEKCQKWEHSHKELQGFLKGILSGSDYCPICGEYLKEDRSVTTCKCSACGKLILSNLLKYKFCSDCGVKFED